MCSKTVICDNRFKRRNCATMFVPIRRDPPIFRESFSDASALQKNVKYRGSASFSCVETKREINLVFAMKSIFISSANSDTDGSEMDRINWKQQNFCSFSPWFLFFPLLLFDYIFVLVSFYRLAMFKSIVTNCWRLRLQRSLNASSHVWRISLRRRHEPMRAFNVLQYRDEHRRSE